MAREKKDWDYSSSSSIVGEAKVPLLVAETKNENKSIINGEDDEGGDVARKVWVESKKLWHIVGPAIFSRIVSYSMFVITQAFAGHLGDLELAAFSIANNVIVGLNFGLLVCVTSNYEVSFVLVLKFIVLFFF